MVSDMKGENMEKGKIYKGANQRVWSQHAKSCTSVEYSNDEGKTWDIVPVDTGKISYNSWFRLKK